MTASIPYSCIAFAGVRTLAVGDLGEVAARVKEAADAGETDPILVYDAVTSRPIELDLRGTLDDVLARVAKQEEPTPKAAPTPKKRGPGRPKLGVVSREVTLLPRHWDWLASQPGGASAALRKLVDRARRDHGDRDRQRLAREAAYRFLSAMAGNLPDFEEATRALFAGNAEAFSTRTAGWPEGIRLHTQQLAKAAFGQE